MTAAETCIFCKIVKGDIPSRKIFEDKDLLAFHDVHPQAPIHFMVIPKAHVASLAEVSDAHQAVLGKMMVLIPRIAKEQGLSQGFRIISNSGAIAGQEVFHLHVHVVGGNAPLPPMLQRTS
jgi:histidine triad (HIT) family protein